jgi:ketosteroid isomerase-like protein
MTEEPVTTESVLDHHIAALGAGDVEELLKDYTQESVLIHPDGSARGLDELRAAFTDFVTGLLKPGTYELGLDSRQVDGEVAFIAWHADCASVAIPMGTDTFVVRNDKIVAQTFAMKVEPK